MSRLRGSVRFGIAMALLFPLLLTMSLLIQPAMRVGKGMGEEWPDKEALAKEGPPKKALVKEAPAKGPWREAVTGMAFVYLPGGTFRMGCHANAGRCRTMEKPARKVRLDGFWMGRHEVTVGQFKAFVNDARYRTDAEKKGGCLVNDGGWKRESGASFRNPGFPQGDGHPVTCVTRADAMAFARWLAAKSGRPIALPSEAQWEYACRGGGTPARYGWGDSRPGEGGQKQANLADRSTGFKWRLTDYDDGFARTAPVGSFPANALGLHDMSGNVWEWVRDKLNYYSELGAVNPVGDKSGIGGVIRGGGWLGKVRFMRCTNRFRMRPSTSLSHIGFRVVRGR